MYAIYGNIYHQYTPNVSIYTIHGSYGICLSFPFICLHNSPPGLAAMRCESPEAYHQQQKFFLSWIVGGAFMTPQMGHATEGFQMELGRKPKTMSDVN